MLRLRFTVRWLAALVLVAILWFVFSLLYGFTEGDARSIAPRVFQDVAANEGITASDYLEPTFEHRPGIGWDVTYQPKRAGSVIVISMYDNRRDIKAYQRLSNGSYRTLRSSR